MIAPDEVQAIVSSDHESRLSFEVERVQLALVEARDALNRAEQLLERLREVEDENVRLRTRLERTEKLEGRVDELVGRIEELSQKAGEEYARGVMDALREKGDLPKKE